MNYNFNDRFGSINKKDVMVICYENEINVLSNNNYHNCFLIFLENIIIQSQNPAQGQSPSCESQIILCCFH